MAKKAYDTGFFRKISVDHSKFKNIIIVNVVEQPVISGIKFYGNRKISDKDITSNIRLKTGMTFSDKKMKKDIEDGLQELLLKKYIMVKKIEDLERKPKNFIQKKYLLMAAIQFGNNPFRDHPISNKRKIQYKSKNGFF